MARRNRLMNARTGRAHTRRTPIPAATLAGIVALLLCLASVPTPGQEKTPRAQEQSDRQQMRGLDEQVQEIKSDVLDISQELSRLEEKLLYPSGTQVAVFVERARDASVRLDAVRIRIDGQLAAHYIYSARELEALRKGGIQRLYVGNVSTGEHRLEVMVDGKLESGKDFSRTEEFSFRKGIEPKLLGLTMAGPGSGDSAVTIRDW